MHHFLMEDAVSSFAQIRPTYKWLLGLLVGLLVFIFGCASGSGSVLPSTPYPLIKNPLAIRLGDTLWLLDADRDTVVGAPIPIGEIRGLNGSMSGDVLALPGGKLYICTHTDGSETMVGHKISVLDWRDWDARKDFEMRSPYHLVKASNGMLYVLSSGNEVLVIDPVVDEEKARIVCNPEDEGQSITATLEGSVYAAATHSICKIDTRTNVVTSELRDVEEGIIAVAAQGNEVYVLHHHAISVMNSQTWQTTATIDLDNGSVKEIQPSNIVLSPMGKAYITQCGSYEGNGYVMVVDTRNHTILTRIPIGGTCNSIAVAASGKIYVTDHQGLIVSVVDPQTDVVVDKIVLSSRR